MIVYNAWNFRKVQANKPQFPNWKRKLAPDFLVVNISCHESNILCALLLFYIIIIVEVANNASRNLSKIMFKREIKSSWINVD